MSDAELIDSLRGFFPDFFDGRKVGNDPGVVLDELTDWLETQLGEDDFARDARAAAFDDIFRESREGAADDHSPTEL